jgi:TusA-related sulfurtransferase
MIQVDARGLSCPEPLIRSRQGINQLNPGDILEILVDTVTSRENVKRFLMSKGYSIEIEDIEGGYKMIVLGK